MLNSAQRFLINKFLIKKAACMIFNSFDLSMVSTDAKLLVLAAVYELFRRTPLSMPP